MAGRAKVSMTAQDRLPKNPVVLAGSKGLPALPAEGTPAKGVWERS